MRWSRSISVFSFCVLLAGCGKSDAQSQPERQVEIPAPVAEEAASDVVTLTPRFWVGDSGVFLHTEVTQQAQSSALHSVTRDILESRRFRLETLEAEPGGVARLRLTMERVTSKVSDNGEPFFEFDSDKPDADVSGPARARALLATLVAEFTISPGGTVLSMSANLTPEDLEKLPVRQHALLAENWFRSAIETLYRPFGDDSTLSTAEPWQTSEPSGAPFVGDEHALIRKSRVAGLSDSAVTIESTSTLYTSGKAKPESYSGFVHHTWSLEDGRLESFRQRQVVKVERPIAGIPGVDTAVKEISLVRVNPVGALDDKEER